LDAWPDRPSTAAFDSEPDSRVLELASSDDLANAVGDRLARDPPLCDVLQRVSITPYPTISTRSPTGSKSEPQTGQDPRSDRLRFRAAWRVLHAKHLKCSIGRPC
jgi:hypothetical protein